MRPAFKTQIVFSADSSPHTCIGCKGLAPKHELSGNLACRTKHARLTLCRFRTDKAASHCLPKFEGSPLRLRHACAIVDKSPNSQASTCLPSCWPGTWRSAVHKRSLALGVHVQLAAEEGLQPLLLRRVLNNHQIDRAESVTAC